MYAPDANGVTPLNLVENKLLSIDDIDTDRDRVESITEMVMQMVRGDF